MTLFFFCAEIVAKEIAPIIDIAFLGNFGLFARLLLVCSYSLFHMNFFFVSFVLRYAFYGKNARKYIAHTSGNSLERFDCVIYKPKIIKIRESIQSLKTYHSRLNH